MFMYRLNPSIQSWCVGYDRHGLCTIRVCLAYDSVTGYRGDPLMPTKLGMMRRLSGSALRVALKYWWRLNDSNCVGRCLYSSMKVSLDVVFLFSSPKETFLEFEILIVCIVSVQVTRSSSPSKTHASCFDIMRLVTALFMTCLQTRLMSVLSPVCDSALGSVNSTVCVTARIQTNMCTYANTSCFVCSRSSFNVVLPLQA